MSVHRLIPHVGAARNELAASVTGAARGNGDVAYQGWLRLSSAARELAGFEAYRLMIARTKENDQ